MAHFFDFAVVKFVPDEIRDESLNAAIVVLHPDHLEVHVTPNPERLHAIAPRLASDTLDDLKASLERLDVASLPTPERLEQLRRLPGIAISDPGSVGGETSTDLNNHIEQLVVRLLTSVRAPLLSIAPKATRLVQELSRTFRRERLLGRTDDDLAKHKVVRNVAVSADGSLRADFVAKNRVMHVTETADLRTPGELTTARLKDIAVAAVTLDEAKRKFGRSTQRYFVYAGSAAAEKQARGYLQAAEHHAEQIFNFASKLDRAAYLDYIYAAIRHDLAGVARLSGNPDTKRHKRHPASPRTRR